MKPMLAQLSKLSSAEEFLDFLGVAFDERVVQVYRLHILKRYYQYLQRDSGINDLDEVSMRERYRALLQRAHDDFVSSTAAREKVFKVFQDAEGTRHVTLDKLSGTLPSRARLGVVAQ